MRAGVGFASKQGGGADQVLKWRVKLKFGERRGYSSIILLRQKGFDSKKERGEMNGNNT
jgi:hypothetical protein